MQKIFKKKNKKYLNFKFMCQFGEVYVSVGGFFVEAKS